MIVFRCYLRRLGSIGWIDRRNPPDSRGHLPPLTVKLTVKFYSIMPQFSSPRSRPGSLNPDKKRPDSQFRLTDPVQTCRSSQNSNPDKNQSNSSWRLLTVMLTLNCEMFRINLAVVLVIWHLWVNYVRVFEIIITIISTVIGFKLFFIAPVRL